MNPCRLVRLPRAGVALLVALALLWLVVSPALAQQQPSPPATPQPQPQTQTFACKYARATEVARILKELLGGKPGQPLIRVGVDDRSNQVIVLAMPEELEIVKRIVRALDVAGTDPERVEEVQVFPLRGPPAPGLVEALKVLFGSGSAARGHFVLDRDLKVVIAKADRPTLETAAELLARLEVVRGEAAPAEMQVRVVWLVSGLAREDTPKPPEDLKEVVAELAKVGFNDPRLAAQAVIRTTAGAQFQSSGTAKLNFPCRLRIEGTVLASPGERTGLQISLEATEETAKGSTPVCRLETHITAPPGHAVVLGVTPTYTMTSAFVVQLLPQKPGTPARRP